MVVKRLNPAKVMFTALAVESCRFTLCVYCSLNDNNVLLETESSRCVFLSNARQAGTS